MEESYLWTECLPGRRGNTSISIEPLEAEDEDFLAELASEEEESTNLSDSDKGHLLFRKRLSSDAFIENDQIGQANKSSDSDLDDLIADIN